MNQYAFIPIENKDKIKLPYAIAMPKTWTFLRKESENDETGKEYAGLEDFEFTEAQKEEILSLGGQWFLNGLSFNEWLLKYG